MEKLVPLARIAIAISMAAFAIQQLIYGAFVTRLIPNPPSWIPSHPALAYISGLIILLAAVAIAFNRWTRAAALLLASIGILSGLLIDLPKLLSNLHNGGVWTYTGKAFALAAAALLVARTFIPLARYFLAAFFVIAGIEHFIYAQFVATLIPSYIPGHYFWTYFAGVALIAGGIGLIIPRTARLAATLSAVMVFLWVWMLHVPRALAAPHDSNETTAVFEAIAFSAAACLLATSSKRGPGRSR